MGQAEMGAELELAGYGVPTDATALVNSARSAKAGLVQGWRLLAIMDAQAFDLVLELKFLSFEFSEMQFVG